MKQEIPVDEVHPIGVTENLWKLTPVNANGSRNLTEEERMHFRRPELKKMRFSIRWRFETRVNVEERRCSNLEKHFQQRSLSELRMMIPLKAIKCVLLDRPESQVGDNDGRLDSNLDHSSIFKYVLIDDLQL
jgi:hypothetical protein